MKVVTSCCGRFHIFDQAAQLHRNGLLQYLITDYPKHLTRRWELPDRNVISLLANGIYNRLVRVLGPRLGWGLGEVMNHSIHTQFSKLLAKQVPEDCDAFIGLSSFSLEALVRVNDLGKISIVDHGSVHQAAERCILEAECRQWGINAESGLPPQWLIEKEQAEFNAAKKVIVLSEFAARTFVENGIDRKKIFVNPCGVNLNQFYPRRRTDDIFRVVQCGAHKLSKGIPYLLQAFEMAKLPKAELWLIGGRMGTGNLDSVLRQMAPPRTQFIDPMPQSQLAQKYSCCSVAVLASVADGFGMVVPQAMACGLPVIVTENVGAADMVKDGVTGYVVPARDSMAIADRLRFLYENPATAKRMGEAAQTFVNDLGGWNRYGDRLTAWIQQQK